MALARTVVSEGLMDELGRFEELVRPLSSALELGARYTFYTQTPGAGPVRFQRQVVLIYAALMRGS